MGFFKDMIESMLAPKEAPGPPRDLGRNEPCWCGSGKKYKRCHLDEDRQEQKNSCSLRCGPT